MARPLLENYYVAVLTIRIDRDLQRILKKLSKETGRTRSAIVRDALRRQLLVAEFSRLRRKSLPYAEAARYFQRDKALHDAAQAANGMNSLFLAKFVRREHGQDNFHHLLRDDLHLLVAGRRRLQRKGIASGCFSAISSVGIGQRDNGFCA